MFTVERPDLLSRVRVVLSHTTHPGNIGATARAMKNMGLADLRLVSPKCFPDPQARAMASGAADLLETARVEPDLDHALADTVYAVALSARRRELSHEPVDPRRAARMLLDHAAHGPVAVVFGQERWGLSNEDVMKCRLLVHIPANPAYPSLNLAQAVQLVTWELRMALAEGGLEQRAAPAPGFEPARSDDIERMFEHLERTLTAVGFLDPAHPRRLMERMRRLLIRAAPEKDEVSILRGILTAVDRIAERESPAPPTGPNIEAAPRDQ